MAIDLPSRAIDSPGGVFMTVRKGDRGHAGSSGPEALGPVLKRLMKDLRIEQRRRGAGIAAAWNDVMAEVSQRDPEEGRRLESQARPVALRQGVLTIEVDGSVLLQELSGFRSRELLEALRGRPGGAEVRTLKWVPAGRS